MIQVAKPPTPARTRTHAPGLPGHISPTAAKSYLTCSLRFYFDGETSWSTCSGGWGYGASNSNRHEGMLALLDPELYEQVHQRMPDHGTVG